MPAVLTPLIDTQRTVVRPVVDSIISDLITYLKLPKNVERKYTSEYNPVPSAGSTIDQPDPIVQLGSVPRIYIRYIDKTAEENLITQQVQKHDYDPIFADQSTGTFIRPVYADSNLEITITANFTSRAKAQDWHTNFVYKANQMREIYLHNLNYHYLLPSSVYKLLDMVYTLREQVEGEGLTKEDYIRKYFTKKLTITSDVGGVNKALAIAEIQTRVVGTLESNNLPEKPTYDDGMNVYTSEITYKLTFNKPIGLYLHYHILIHNQLIPYSYMDHTTVGKIEDYSGTPSYLYEGMYEYDKTMNRDTQHRLPKIYRIPKEDEFIPFLNGLRSSIIFSALLTIEDNEPLLNLNDLGDYVIDEDIMYFIKDSEYLYLGDIYKSGLTLLLYINEQMAPSGSLKVDKDGNVTPSFKLSKKDRHRVVLVLNTDPNLIMHKYFIRLHKYPRAIVKMLLSVNSGLEHYPEHRISENASRFENSAWDHLYRWYKSADNNRVGNGFQDHPKKLNIPALKRMYEAPVGRTVQGTHIFAQRMTDDRDNIPIQTYHESHFIRE